MGPVERVRTGALRCTRTGNRANTLSKTPLMKSDGQQKQPLIPPQWNKKTRGGERGQAMMQNHRENEEERERPRGEKEQSQENRRTRQRAGQAVGLTQQEGLFNKHELEPSAIE